MSHYDEWLNDNIPEEYYGIISEMGISSFTSMANHTANEARKAGLPKEVIEEMVRLGLGKWHGDAVKRNNHTFIVPAGALPIFPVDQFEGEIKILGEKDWSIPSISNGTFHVPTFDPLGEKFLYILKKVSELPSLENLYLVICSEHIGLLVGKLKEGIS